MKNPDTDDDQYSKLPTFDDIKPQKLRNQFSTRSAKRRPNPDPCRLCGAAVLMNVFENDLIFECLDLSSKNGGTPLNFKLREKKGFTFFQNRNL